MENQVEKTIENEMETGLLSKWSAYHKASFVHRHWALTVLGKGFGAPCIATNSVEQATKSRCIRAGRHCV